MNTHKNNLQTVNRKEIHIIKQTMNKEKREKKNFRTQFLLISPTKTSSPKLLRVKMKVNKAMISLFTMTSSIYNTLFLFECLHNPSFT